VAKRLAFGALGLLGAAAILVAGMVAAAQRRLGIHVALDDYTEDGDG